MAKTSFQPDGVVNLPRWVRENWAAFLPPVGNKQLFEGARDVILFVSAGPNTRNDYHVNPTEELFYQLKGDIAVRIRPLDGSPPHDVVVKEGDVYLLPAWVPHRPQRPAGTLGLIAEFPRPEGMLDGLRWYCPRCDMLVYEAQWRLKKIDEDLHVLMNEFWDGPEDRRTCAGCGYVVQRAPEFSFAGKKRENAKSAKRTKVAAKRAVLKMTKKTRRGR